MMNKLKMVNFKAKLITKALVNLVVFLALLTVCLVLKNFILNCATFTTTEYKIIMDIIILIILLLYIVTTVVYFYYRNKEYFYIWINSYNYKKYLGKRVEITFEMVTNTITVVKDTRYATISEFILQDDKSLGYFVLEVENTDSLNVLMAYKGFFNYLLPKYNVVKEEGYDIDTYINEPLGVYRPDCVITKSITLKIIDKKSKTSSGV